MGDFPIRQLSALGLPKPSTSIERTCACCGASFLDLAPGSTGERGLWEDWSWFCSQECFDAPRGLRRGNNGVQAVLERRMTSNGSTS